MRTFFSKIKISRTLRVCFTAGSFLVIFLGDATAQQKRLYLALDDHTDYMWTADEATYDSAFVHMLDYYLAQIDSTKKEPSDFQSRFNCDGSLWLKAYQKHRSPARFARLVAAIKSGHISAPLNMLVSCYGAQPTEAVIRGMYYAGSLERRYGLRFTMAGAMENNTLPFGLASLWSGSGARYSWKGIGGYGSQLSYEVRTKRPHQMYRYTGPDSAGVLMKWYNYNEKKTAPLGGYAECRLHIKYKNLRDDFAGVINLLDAYCDTVSALSTYQYNVASAFGFGHDDLETYVSDPLIAAAKAATTTNRKVRVSNEEDFFRDFERTYPGVPSKSVSFGNEWDLLVASMNETTARVRRAAEKLRSAEALAAVVSLTDKTFLLPLTAMRNKAWETFGVYWEHNWTADGPVSRKKRAAWQEAQQQALTAYADTLLHLAKQHLSTQLRKSANPTFYVFNSLSWVRDDVADFACDQSDSVRVVDGSTGKEVASQWIWKEGKSYLRIWARNVPSVGYKIYGLAKKAPLPTTPLPANTAEFSNRFYRVQVSASGAITALYDSLAGGRQIATKTNGRYLNDLGSTDVADGDPVMIENTGPVSTTFKTFSKNPVAHTARITLYANSPRIEIDDSIQQNFGDVKTWSFSFNLAHPTTRHEELGAVLTVKKETRGGHYAAAIARYDWQTFNHFADVSEAGYGITLSNNDCSFFKLGSSTIDSLWEGSAQLNALAGGNIDKKVEDGGVLGILNQNGQQAFAYKFAIISHQSGFNATAAMKASLEHQNPLVTGPLTGGALAKAGQPFSLLSINHPDVLLWSIKPAEEGVAAGLIARFWNMAETPAVPVITTGFRVSRVWHTSHIETNIAELKKSAGRLLLQVGSLQLKTFRLQLK